MTDGKNGNEAQFEAVDVLSISRNRASGAIEITRSSNDLALSLGLLEIARVILTVPFERGLTTGGPRVIPASVLPLRPR
jgi:hypothetical protein